MYSRIAKALCAGLILAMAAAACANPSDKPEDLLAAYFSYAGLSDYSRMYGMLSKESKALTSFESFEARNKNIYSGMQAENISIEILRVSRYPSNAAKQARAVDYTVSMDTLAGALVYENQSIFTKEGNEYCLEWSSSVIHPKLGESDKVWVTSQKGKRGSIYDRNGILLAGMGIAHSVGFVPAKMAYEMQEGYIAYDQESIKKAAQLLGLNADAINAQLSDPNRNPDSFLHLRTVQRSESLEESLLAIPGILINDVEARLYPLGESASHLIGYIQPISAQELAEAQGCGYSDASLVGKVGIEKLFESVLRAADGYEIAILDSEGNTKETLALKKKSDGADIALAIDSHLQRELYSIYSEDTGCSVAMDCNTGEVLALVSTPAYDPNDFSLGMPQSVWESILGNPNNPLFNRFKEAICPGSTMKPITAAIALDTGSVSFDEDLGKSGQRWQNGSSWGGYSITTAADYIGHANIENALVYSDNIYFAKAALRIGPTLFASELRKYGFEEEVPFEFGLRESCISASQSFGSEIALADSGYGQGQILINPIHMACIYSAFINSGSMPKPTLLYGQTPEIWKEGVMSTGTASAVLGCLVQAVERGTASKARIPGMALAGKTGTAELKNSKDEAAGKEIGWFAAMNADKAHGRQLVIVSVVEGVESKGGSAYVVGKAKKAFEHIGSPYSATEP
ncbi:MAG: penicillin-binding transpeptidase domain-containing protein [Eubacteriaceae bacterium]|nr:penicillin-binding transpeptidase domain-containing protein [Eubacteriaceae bacterium]